MIKIHSKKDCSGCTACFSVCPKQAIEMVEDKTGNFYPSVNREKCIDCQKCNTICPILSTVSYNGCMEYDIKSFLAWNNDERIRKQSTSGGIFSALAISVLEHNGVIAGVHFDDDKKAVHTIIDNENDLFQLYKAKYVQSDIQGVFNRVKSCLCNNVTVLFSGTPCQVAGLKSFLGKEYDWLITIEVICHGVVSQRIFDKYLLSLEAHSKKKISYYEFRNKTPGWKDYSSLIRYNDNSFSSIPKEEDTYLKGYLDYSLFLRPSCTECRFKGFPRVADITLGDFWGIESFYPDDNKGISAVLVNSTKGEQLFSSVNSKIHYKEVEINSIISGNLSLVESTQLGEYSGYFYKHFDKTDFIDLIHKIEKKDYFNRLNYKEKIAYLIKRK